MKQRYVQSGALALAGLLAVTLGVTAPAGAESATGSIAGRLTDGGVAVSGAEVLVEGMSWQRASTDADGFYRAEGLQPGDNYRVRFILPNGLNQYAVSATRSNTATVYTVRAGEELTVNDSVLPRGSMQGRFVDSNGTPIAGAEVTVNLLGGGPGARVSTDSGGQWRVDTLFAEVYNVQFGHSELGILQSAFGRTPDDGPGDPVTVSAGAVTTVNDTALPRGSVRVRARDAATGQPVNSFYTEIFPRNGNTVTGQVILDRVQAGNRRVDVSAEGYLTGQATVAVSGGAQADVTVDLVRPAQLELTVVDATTGAPVPGVCVDVVTLLEAAIATECDGNNSDEQGRISYTYLTADRYQLFALPREAPGFGAQWVGPDGGVGQQLKAKSFELRAGQTTRHTIRVDRAGTITGRVTKSDGQPLANGRVGLMPGGEPYCCASYMSVRTDDNGNYTIDFAGPYDWQLTFTDDHRQFSGQTSIRHAAKTVRVTSGAVTAYNFQFKATVSVRVTVSGVPVVSGSGFLFVHNTFTGDDVTWGIGDFTGPVTFRVVGSQYVKFKFIDAQHREHWYGGTDFTSAKAIWLPSSGSRTFALNF